MILFSEKSIENQLLESTLRPMETIQIHDLGSVVINLLEINNKLDVNFKPGLFLQTKDFLDEDYNRFCCTRQQKEYIEKFYSKIIGL